MQKLVSVTYKTKRKKSMSSGRLTQSLAVVSFIHSNRTIREEAEQGDGGK